MANSLETYDPKKIDVIIAGNIISGFGDEVVSVERDADAFEDDIGAQGDVVRYATNDKRGLITITLLQTSASNLSLSALAKADELSGAGIFPAAVRDNGGQDLHLAAQAWIRKVPKATYKKGVEMRVWEIRTNNLVNFLGGA